MSAPHKKIGIWGLGATGKSAISYFRGLGYELAVIDQKTLSPDEQELLRGTHSAFYTQDNIETFLQTYDVILPSPGIDIRPYVTRSNTWLNELDIFYSAWKKPIIAITGSIGKTTITHLLSKLLKHNAVQVATGGNIGTPMLDLLAQKDESDMVLLELSSFQLEQCKEFAPDLAIWTNLYPNHLDRHGSEQEYLAAKAQIIAHQKDCQQALIPLNLKDCVHGSRIIHYFSAQLPTQEQLASLPATSKLFYIHNGAIVIYNNGTTTPIILCNTLPTITFEENWLIMCSALTLLNQPLPEFDTIDLALPEHRLEKVATIHGVTFYNDSKSTTSQSTLAAVNALKNKPILLLLGGLGKGVDRSPLIADLKGQVKKIYCFGKEAEQLHAYCIEQGIPSAAFHNLDAAFAACVADMQPGDQVLLSPAGSSYDLFAHYIERGMYFKKLVYDLTLTAQQ
ncbi:MAG: UDP-N-acetylmuramoyl-L-alanine--D-glutamate ligase [Candidatus Dependentiae bacterium]|nr:UDP-N-acetylmuramoyl-L-alanine--D-glutamate ligase [Candidatus Dependentiae bacterium]